MCPNPHYLIIDISILLPLFFNLLPTLSALENVALPLVLDGRSQGEADHQAEILLTKIGLEKRQHHLPEELSGGEIQRVAVARALAFNPPILLADEPTGNLDSKTSVEVMGVFQKLNEQGITIVMVTHELDIAHYCKRNLILRDGVLVRDEIVQNRSIAEREMVKIREAEAAAKLTAAASA